MNARRKLFFLSGKGGSPAPVFDSDYQAVLDYATAQSYTLPSAAQQTAQNQLVLDLKAAGVWAKLDSFAVFATNGNGDFALIDWKRLITMTAFNAPAFTVNQGYKGNGSSAYINTLFSPANNGVNYALNSCSFGYYAYSVLDTISSTLNMGARDNISPLTALSYPATSSLDNLFEKRLFINSNNVDNPELTSNSNALGLRHFTRVDANRNEMYDDTGFIGSNTNTSGQLGIQPFYLLALNNAGSATLNSSADMSFYFAGGDLTGEHTAFNTALKTYIGAI